MTRVLHIYRTYFPDPPGGIQEAIRQICRSTARQGVESSVFCLSPHPRPPYLEQKEPVWRERSWAAPASCDLGGVSALRQFSRLAREHDVLHFHFPWPFADLMHLTARTHARTVMTYHSDIVRQSTLGLFYSPVMWRMLSSMDRIVATSPAYAQSSHVLSDPRITSRVEVIPLGLEDTTDNGTEMAKDEDFNDAAPYFLFVGALRYYKGLPTLLEAARHVPARILIAGEGLTESELKRQASEMGLSNVEFLGPIENREKFGLLRGCKALVLPSDQRSEAFGMVLIEASMYGKPMISTELQTGTSYVNAHMQTGYVVPPRDPVALADAMNALLRDPHRAQEFGKAARLRYQSLFSGTALGVAYRGLYNGLYGERMNATR